jgi:hypothetical protein
LCGGFLWAKKRKCLDAVDRDSSDCGDEGVEVEAAWHSLSFRSRLLFARSDLTISKRFVELHLQGKEAPIPKYFAVMKTSRPSWSLLSVLM